MAVSTVGSANSHGTSYVRSKFRGCLMGAVLGDCLGQEFEMNSFADIPIKKVQKFTRSPYETRAKLHYTDDTAMTRSLADCLISCRAFDGEDLARRFTEEFFRDQDRGYGANVGMVFSKLKKTGYRNPEGPANDQFDGAGSYGNGAAMRVAPVALFTYGDSVDKSISLAMKTSRITHSHRQGVNGAILQTLAIRKCFEFDENNRFLDALSFIDDLTMQMVEIEQTLCKKNELVDDSNNAATIMSNIIAFRNNITNMEGRCTSYVEALGRMYRLLQNPNSVNTKTICATFGNGVAAIEAVPAALFAFLYTACDTNKSFMDTIEYAISIGGDTDTIATMAGAIAGNYYGDKSLPNSWMEKCEGVEYARNQADELFDYAITRNVIEQ